MPDNGPQTGTVSSIPKAEVAYHAVIYQRLTAIFDTELRS